MGVKISFYSALKAACRRIRYHFCVVTVTFGCFCFFRRPCWIVTIVFTLPFALSPALPPTGRHSCGMNFLLMVLTNLFPTHTHSLSLQSSSNRCSERLLPWNETSPTATNAIMLPLFYLHRSNRVSALPCVVGSCTENGTHSRLFELHPII